MPKTTMISIGRAVYRGTDTVATPIHHQSHMDYTNEGMKFVNSLIPPPIVLTKKQDGSTRFCVDFRKLNDKKNNDARPLPKIEDALRHACYGIWLLATRG